MKKLSLLIAFILSFFIVLSETNAAELAGPGDSCRYTDYKGLLDCDPDRKSCIQDFVTGGCHTECPFENLNSQECLSCLSSECGITAIYNESIAESSSNDFNDDLINAANNSKINGNTSTNDGGLCNPSDGINCSMCSSSDHGTCVRNCINKEYVEGGKCYSDCYYEGKGYYLDSKSCNECLNKVCDRELRSGDRLLEPSASELSEDWDFCDKHGVLRSMQIVNRALFVAKIVVPILLIVFGIIELSKAVISSDDNAIRNSVNSLIKKLIIGLIIFFVPTIVKAIFGQIDDYTSLSDNGCYVCLFGDDKCDNLIANSNDD